MSKINPIKLCLLFGIFLSGCASHQQPKATPSISNLYQYELFDSGSQQAKTLGQILPGLAEVDVVFIGEYHTHSASHLLQAQLLSELHRYRPNLILSMEQFTRDKQGILDDYLSAQIGEQTLIKQGNAWDNYQSDYRPLVEFAKTHKLAVIAANTPLSVVRCVARKGPEIIQELDNEQQNWVATDITTSSDLYQQKFAQAMGHHSARKHKSPVKPSNSFYAQLARDNTMAESILKALKQQPGSLLVHTNGAFHSNYHLGTVDALKRLAPELKIQVISPHFVSQADDWAKGDIIYKLKDLPSRYLQKQNQAKAIKQMMETRKNNGCEL